MKKRVMIMILVIVCFIAFGSDIQTFKAPLEALYYNQDILTTGIDHSYDFYFPVVISEAVQEGFFTFNYAMTPLSGPKTMYVLMMNGTSVEAGYLENHQGQMTLSVPTELFESGPLIRITLHITLDYPLCDQSRVNRNALWFRLKKDSFFAYSYVEKDIDTIPLFLSTRNPHREYEMIYDGTFESLKAYVAMAQYMGFLSKGIQRSIEVSTSPTGLENKIIINEAPGTFTLSGGTLNIPTDFNDWQALSYMNAMPTSAMTITQADIDGPKNQSLSFSQLGIESFRSDVVFSNRMSYPIVLDAFGGVPEGVDLKLNFSVFNRLREEGFVLNVFLNEYLLKSIDLSDKEIHERKAASIPIPSHYFSAYNTLTFETVNQKSDCDEFSLMVYGDSSITFKDSRDYQNPYINEYPYSVYGKTLYVVSDYSKTTAQSLVNLAFEKGRVSAKYAPPQVITLNALLEKETLGSDYDSLVFLIDAQLFYPLTELIDLSDEFSIYYDTDEILFQATTADPFDVVYSFNYKGLPAVVFSGYNQPENVINDTFFGQMSKAVSDFALFSEAGVFSFETGKDQFSVVSEGEDEMIQSSFWMKNRLWIIVLAVVIILFILLSSYNKTSKGR